MTCEIVVANRLAIALAADSAVTFTNGSAAATYASGANKIFQLAADDPVAVMVYNQADLNRVPWEVILKAYRRALGAKKFASLKDYVVDLADFMNNRAAGLFPVEVRDAATKSSFYQAFICTLEELFKLQPKLNDSATSMPDLQQGWADGMAAAKASLDPIGVDGALDPADLADVQARMSPDLAAEAGTFLASKLPHLVPVVDVNDLVDLALQTLFKRPMSSTVSYTGVVIAGFGADTYMPGYSSSTFYGFIGRRVFWTAGSAASVDYADKASFIEPFARKSMIETFTQGASPEVWKAVRDAFEKHAAQVVTGAAGRAGVTIDDASIAAAVQHELRGFTMGWAFTVFDAHLRPLNAVIAGLNVEELAELAETLVMLESLKEKVTSRTQGVGGPIDVAVITKGEGLVWIKRKHYFNPELNQRYLLRLQRGA